METLVDRLKTALAGRYAIERELGHGGMATVCLAVDLKHHRQVAIKVLRPELAAALGPERFLREIETAARLNHPHILPLHDSGDADGLLYYVMPFVAGESLRNRMDRTKQLPLETALETAREVADALAYAHTAGIVHRDIKPENILFVEGHAVVSDFGIARAISAAAGEKLTATGISVGTPAYMSPEQAASDAPLDGRSDVYSLGCVLYEMLAGEPPYTGSSAQAVIAKRLGEPVPHLRTLREVPEAIERAVTKALAKSPADRFATAAELRQALTAPVAAASEQEGRPRLAAPSLRVAGIYGVAAVGVFGMTEVLTTKLGLPSWVIAAAAVLLLVGLPIMVATGLMERRRAVARATGVGVVQPGGLRGLLTWRRALAGGGLAFTALGVGTAAYMAMRLLGIGPLGTLVASGVMKNKEPVILANFTNQAPDPTLGRSLTEAFRVDLAESPTVKLVDAQVIGAALERMERSPATPLEAPLAREIAQRENVKAIVTGEIDPVGTGYVLSASVVAAADGRVLTAVRETAASDAALIGALDRLSRKLRERIGESLTSIRTTEPLERVTTGSLEALRKYSEAARAISEGEIPRGFALYQEAVAIDTSFAMAYRKIAVLLSNAFDSPAAIAQAATKAYVHRNRLPEIERDLATSAYYTVAEYDPQKAAFAYRAVLERDPDNATALGNLAELQVRKRQWAAAESLAIRAASSHPDVVTFAAVAITQARQGRHADARATLDLFARMAPRHPALPYVRSLEESVEGDYVAAERDLRELRAEQRDNAVFQTFASSGLAQVNETRGKLGQAARDIVSYMGLSEHRGLARDYLVGAAWLGGLDVRYRNRPLAGLRRVEAALARHPLSAIAPLDRPYSALAAFYAGAGRPEVAHHLLAEYERVVPEAVRRGNPQRWGAAGALALAEGRVLDAMVAYRAWTNEAFEAEEGLFELATAFERAQQLDSALRMYEQVVSTPPLFRIPDDAHALGPSLKRLGELYEARGDRRRARDSYARFVDLWKDADPELQPVVADARAALKRLSVEPR